MSPKFLLLIFGLVAIGSIEAKDFLKSLRHKELSSSFLTRLGGKTDTLTRRRRNAEENAATAAESASLSSGEAEEFMKFFLEQGWKSEKVDILSSFIEEMADHETNLTVIGWQRVLDEQGKVKEINTLQLIFPPKPLEGIPTNVVDEDEFEEDEEDDRLLPYNVINQMRELFDPMAKLGIPASITMEEFNSNGETEVLIYIDKDELYVSTENFAVYNKTAVVSQQEVSDFVASLKPGALGKPSILKYDVDENLLLDQSHIKPHLLGAVMDYYEAPDEILIASPAIISTIYAQYDKEEIPKQLALTYNKDFPAYKWRVLTDPEHFYVTRDVSVTVTYDNFDLDEFSDISYVVYGIKKSANK